MSGKVSYQRVRGLLLFIMLVMCTLLHGLSVAHSYAPGVRKILSLIGINFK